MSDVDTGMHEAHKYLSIAEAIFTKLSQKLKKDPHYKEFDEAVAEYCKGLGVSKVYSNDTVTLLETRKGRDYLNWANIPHVLVEQDGKNYIAVPKQYEKQANMLFYIKDEIEKSGETITPQDKTFFKSFAQQLSSNESISNLSVPFLKNGHFCAIAASTPVYLQALSREMKEKSIPHTSFTNSQTGQSYLVFNKKYEGQFNMIDESLQHQPTELQRAEFMKENLGKDIIEHKGLTAAQAAYIQKELAGSCLGINLEKQNDDTYTLRYNAEKEKYVAPVALEAIIKSNGPEGKNMEMQTRAVEAAVTAASTNQPIAVVDVGAKQDDPSWFIINKDGMQKSDGSFVSRQDPNFNAKVWAEAQQMTIAFVDESKKISNDRQIENIYTVEEIQRARQRAAIENPDKAYLFASQMLSPKMIIGENIKNAAAAASIQSYVDFANKMSRANFADILKMDASEIKDAYGIPDSSFAKFEEFLESYKSLSEEERKQLVSYVSTITDAINEQKSAVTTRKVTQNDISLKDIEEEMDRDDRDDRDDEERKDYSNDYDKSDDSDDEEHVPPEE